MSEPRGLRERKKARTRAAIQEHALRLFAEQGYRETTTTQIADAAEISPSTLFRYFTTKEDIVLYDTLDEEIYDAILAQPADLSPARAVRAGMIQVLDTMSSDASGMESERQRLVMAVPELRMRMYEQLVSGIGVLASAVAARLGREPDDQQIRMWSGGVIGVFLGALDPASGGLPPFEPGHHGMRAVVEVALDLVEDGLRL